MSYNKKTWEEGDVITSEALNNIENELETLDGAAGPYAVTATAGKNESQKMTLTFNKTAAEIYAVCQTGRLFKMSFSAGENVDVECVCAVQGIKNDVGGTITYAFRADTDKTYFCAGLVGTDAVVLTEV